MDSLPAPAAHPSRFRVVFWVSVLLATGITAGHYLTPVNLPQVHDALRRLYYLPIVLMGVRYGVRGGFGIALAIAVAYTPHIFTHWHGDPLGPNNLNRSFEIMMYLIVGLLTGMLSDREQRARMDTEAALAAARQSGQAARDAARNLLEAQEQLRRADRLATLGVLSAGLAHEVRNPLASLRGIADMLADDYPVGHARRELVDIMRTEVDRLDGVVGTFLDNARGRPGEGPASVADAARGVCALLSREAARRSVGLERDITPGDLQLPMPPEALSQILLNVTLNALQALEGTGGGTVTLGGRRVGEETVVSVSDTGPGFPAEVVRQAPEPFFTTREHGTGLGLAICREIIASHGGRLELDNLPAGGARVSFAFGGSNP